MYNHRMTRRAVLGTTGAAAAVAFLPKNGVAQAGLPEINTLRSTSKSWLWAVEDYGNAGGFFTEAGVKVNSNASNRGTNIAALQSDGVDIVLGDPSEPLRARVQGLKIRMIASMVNRYAAHIVMKNSVLSKVGVSESSPVEAKIAALKGLKLGTTGPGAAGDALFRFLSSVGNFDPNKDVQLVPIQGGGPAMIAALQKNVIDGFCLSSPTADLAVQKEDCSYLFQMALNPPPQMAEVQFIVASAGERTIATKRDALVLYCRGLALTQRSIANEPEKFKAWARVWFEGLDPLMFETAFSNNGRIYFQDPVPNEELFKKNIDYVNIVNSKMGAEPLPSSIDFASLADPTIAQDAMKGL
jgi:NitT/TauT family transport system substrate-binding protein